MPGGAIRQGRDPRERDADGLIRLPGGGRSGPGEAHARAAAVARAQYGRLLGIVAARTGDIALAEDALSAALEQALVHWPVRGVPENPEGWLVRVARNRLADAHRRALRRGETAADPDLLVAPAPSDAGLPDPRLGLMCVCAHPAIAPQARAPLMLQTVLGFTAAEIARAYVLSPAALGRMLGRAKMRIKANAIPFRLPEAADLPQRIEDLCEAVYGAYAMVWTEAADARDMQREALFLADLLAELLPDAPEVLGLSALIAFLHARRDARLRDGVLVPLDAQDTGLWDAGLIASAEARLGRAFALGRPGRFQIEAAIQSVHAARARTGRTDWAALAELYHGLLALAPTLGAQVSQAAVLARVAGPDAGLSALDALAPDRVSGFQPYWATRAHLLALAGQAGSAAVAYDRAISLSLTAPQRQFLTVARDRLART